MAGKRSPGGHQVVGPVLRLCRESKGWSVDQLAEKTGLSPGHLRRLESSDAAAPRLDTILRLTAALGVSLNTLLARKPAGDPPRLDYLSIEDTAKAYAQLREKKFCLQIRQVPTNMTIPPEILAEPGGRRVFAAAGWADQDIDVLARTNRLRRDIDIFDHKDTNLMCVVPARYFRCYEPDWIAATMDLIRRWDDHMGVVLLGDGAFAEVDRGVREELGLDAWTSVGCYDGYVHFIRPRYDTAAVDDHGLTTQFLCERMHGVLRKLAPRLRNVNETPAPGIMRQLTAHSLSALDAVAVALRRPGGPGRCGGSPPVV